MQQRTNNQVQNKGFTIHVGETYVGYLTIGEKNTPATTVLALQNPDNMKAVLEKAELRPYADKAPADMSSVDAIITAHLAPVVEAPVVSEASESAKAST